MKTKVITGLLPIVFFLIQSCGENNIHTSKPCRGASFELSMQTGRDTINLTDCDSIKQGRWLIYKWAVLNKQIGPERITDEEGFYKDNKKQGFWKKYSNEGNVIDSIEYKDGVAVAR